MLPPPTCRGRYVDPGLWHFLRKEAEDVNTMRTTLALTLATDISGSFVGRESSWANICHSYPTKGRRTTLPRPSILALNRGPMLSECVEWALLREHGETSTNSKSTVFAGSGYKKQALLLTMMGRAFSGTYAMYKRITTLPTQVRTRLPIHTPTHTGIKLSMPSS